MATPELQINSLITFDRIKSARNEETPIERQKAKSCSKRITDSRSDDNGKELRETEIS